MSDENVIVLPDDPDTVVVTPVELGQEFILITEGTMGPRGPQGEQGPPGDGALETLAYTFTQATPATTWIINHPLAFVPSVTVVDSAGTEQIGSVEYPSPGTILLSFGGAFSGTAYLS